MEAVPLTRAYLESLTTGNLIKMADTMGIDIPPDLDRIFVIEELLEISSADGAAEDAPDVSPDLSGESSAAPKVPPEADGESVLPRQYNITFIEVMIRDPLWAFVFWEIKAQDKDQFEKAFDFEGYYLKVSPWGAPADLGRPMTEAEGVFTVPVTSTDTAWYLGLSPALDYPPDQTQNNQKQYKVELCVGIKGEETILAVSSPFNLPLLHELPAGAESCAEGNPLGRLSGCRDFQILRNNERTFRAKRGASAGSNE